MGEPEAPTWVDPSERPGVVIESPVAPIARVPRARFYRGAAYLAAAAAALFAIAVLQADGVQGAGRAALFGAAAGAGVMALATVMRRTVARSAQVPPIFALWVFLSGLMVVMFFAVISRRPMATSVLDQVWSLLFPPGFLLVFTSFRRRTGSALHCAKCDYGYAPGPRAPSQCPECGAAWWETKGLRRGTRVPDAWGRAIAGALLVACGLFSTQVQGWARSAWPTGLLITQVTDPSAGFLNKEWAELSRRNLSKQEIDRLVTTLLDMRKEGHPIDSGAETWIGARIASGSLGTDLVERYYGEMLSARIIVPEPGRLGQGCHVSIEAWERSSIYGGSTCFVAFGGFRISDEEGTRARSEEWEHAMSFGSAIHRYFGTGTEGGAVSPETEVVPERTGVVHITAEYWLLVMPSKGGHPPLTWQPDGTPAIPAGALYSKRVELKTSINVEE